MKYQYILNKKILFETNSPTEYFRYLLNLEDNSLKNDILHDLLGKSNGYICEMATAQTNY